MITRKRSENMQIRIDLPSGLDDPEAEAHAEMVKMAEAMGFDTYDIRDMCLLLDPPAIAIAQLYGTRVYRRLTVHDLAPIPLERRSWYVRPRIVETDGG